MAITPAEDRLTLEPDGLQLTMQRWGNIDDPIILALHGWLDNSNSFHPVAPLLAEQGYQVLALDWPGHGCSQHRGQGNHYHFLDYLFDLHRVVTSLPTLPHCLLGHSMGGILVQLFAGIYPELVKNLAVIEAVGPLVDEPGEARDRIRRGFAMRSKSIRLDRGYADIQPLIRARAEANSISPELAELLLLRSLERRDGRWYWRSDPRLRQRSAWMMTEQQAKQYLDGWGGPSLLILAEQGYSQLKLALAKRRSWFADVQERVVKGGHHCHMTSPQQVASEILSYLKSM